MNSLEFNSTRTDCPSFRATSHGRGRYKKLTTHIMRIKPFLLTAFLLIATGISANPTHLILYDKNLSPEAGSENIITFHKAFCLFEDKYLPLKLFNEETWLLKSFGISYRLSKIFLLDYPIDLTVLLIQHEIFGHGAKFREHGFVENSYNIKLPFPYGESKGSAYIGHYKNENKYRLQSTHERMEISYGGMEANNILSRNVLAKWLINGKINYREAPLYLGGFHNTSLYIFRTKYSEEYSSRPGNDISSYLWNLNFNYAKPPNLKTVDFNEGYYKLTLNDLEKQAAINLLDPFQYFALYTYWVKYAFGGKQTFNIPMISIGKKLKYLPSFHLGLTPFGSELYFENYLVLDSKMISAYYRHGDPTFDKSYGAGINGTNLLSFKNIALGLSMDVWRQPFVELGGEYTDWNYRIDAITESTNTIGWSLGINMFFQIKNTGLYSELKYKTDGYLQGEQLRNGLIWRIGVGFGKNELGG